VINIWVKFLSADHPLELALGFGVHVVASVAVVYNVVKFILSMHLVLGLGMEVYLCLDLLLVWLLELLLLLEVELLLLLEVELLLVELLVLLVLLELLIMEVTFNCCELRLLVISNSLESPLRLAFRAYLVLAA